MEKRDDVTLKQTLATWINTQNMQPIVDKITPLIWTDINIVNAGGIIVASSKPHRIGKYHNAAKQFLESDKEQLIIEHTNDIPGVLHGVNFPICMEGIRVGMIGITGKPEEVQLIAKLVCELLQFHITMARRDQEESYLVQLRYRFLHEWLFDKEIVISRAFAERGAALDIHIFEPWTVGIFSLRDYPDYSETQAERIQQYMRNCLNGEETQVLSICVGKEMIVLVQEADGKKVLELVRRLQLQLESAFSFRFPAGIGRNSDDPKKIALSVQDARMMYRLSEKKGRDICSSDEMRLELLLQRIPREESAQLFFRVFGGFSKAELVQAMEMLKAYSDYNGSILRVAEKLHIHKNTLQYRLNKFAERTGYVPQHVPDMSYLYILIKIYELEIKPQWN